MAAMRNHIGSHLWFWLVCFGACLFTPRPVHAALLEQTYSDMRSMALAGSVTASPFGVMAIHYNPAGLSNMDEGTLAGFGLVGTRIDSEARFRSPAGYTGEPGYGLDPVAGEESDIDGIYGYSPFAGVDQSSDNQNGAEIMPSFGGILHKGENSRLTVGWGFYTPLSGGYYYDDEDPAIYGGKEGYFNHFVYSAPSLGYKISDSFSAGVTVCMGYTAHGLTLPFRPPRNLSALTGQTGGGTAGMSLPLTPDGSMPTPWYGGPLSPYDAAATMTFDLEDRFTPSVNIGFLWEPLSYFSLGASYQSSVKTVMTGDYRFDYSSQWQTMIGWFDQAGGAASGIPADPVAFQSGSMVTDIDIPQMAHAGIKLSPSSRLHLMADLHWADWSVVDKTVYKFDQDIQFLQFLGYSGYREDGRTLVIPRKMKDTFNWSVGLELQVNSGFVFRCGYEDRKTSVNGDYFDLTVPVADMDVYGVGFGLLFENGVTLDFGLSVVDGGKYTAPNNTSRLLNSTNVAEPVYNPYAGLDYEMDADMYIVGFSLTIPFKLKPEKKAVEAEKTEDDLAFENRMDELDQKIRKVSDLDQELKRLFEKVDEETSEIEIKKRYEKVEEKESDVEVTKIYEKLEEKESDKRVVKIHEKIEEKESEEQIKKRFEEAIRKEVEEEVKKRYEKVIEKQQEEARKNKKFDEEKRDVNITPFEDVERR